MVVYPAEWCKFMNQNVRPTVLSFGLATSWPLASTSPICCSPATMSCDWVAEMTGERSLKKVGTMVRMGDCRRAHAGAGAGAGAGTPQGGSGVSGRAVGFARGELRPSS